MPRLEVIQAEFPIHGKELHGGLGFRQRRHESVVSVADSGLTDHVGQDIVGVVLLLLKQLIDFILNLLSHRRDIVEQGQRLVHALVDHTEVCHNLGPDLSSFLGVHHAHMFKML